MIVRIRCAQFIDKMRSISESLLSQMSFVSLLRKIDQSVVENVVT